LENAVNEASKTMHTVCKLINLLGLHHFDNCHLLKIIYCATAFTNLA